MSTLPTTVPPAAAGQVAGSSSRQQPTPAAPEGDAAGASGHDDDGGEANGAPGGSGEDRGVSGRQWFEALTGSWAGVVKGLAAVAGFGATYDLAKTLGTGGGTWDPDVLWSVVAFGVGVVLLLVVGVAVSASHRQWTSDLVWQERRRTYWREGWTPRGTVREHIDRETLLAHDDVVAFQAALLQAIKRVRRRWEAGQEPLPHEQRLLDAYQVQRTSMLAEQGRRKAHRTSAAAIVVALLGVVLAVGGYANAWYLTNLEVASGALAKADADHQRAIEMKVVDAALSRPDAQPVVPDTPSDVTFTLRDADEAASLLGPDAVDVACWQTRAGIALSWGRLDGPNAGRLLVAAPATDACNAVTAWLEPGHLSGPLPTPTPTPAATSATATQSPATTAPPTDSTTPG